LLKYKRLLCLSFLIITAVTLAGCQSKTNGTTNPVNTSSNTSNSYGSDKNEGVSTGVSVDNNDKPDSSQVPNPNENKPIDDIPPVVEPSIYRLGSSGDTVIKIQEDLKKLGYDIDTDGNFGKGTKNAVVDFQTRTGLDADGEVGDTTMSKLDEPPTDQTKYFPIDYTNFNSETKEGKEAFMNINTFYSSTPYFIIANLEKREVNIFQGTNKQWVLANTYQCDVGKPSTPTITGRYRTNLKGKSFGADEGFECKYFTQIHGNYLFHSILFNTDGSVQDGRLGLAISHGCIRLALENAKWIYDNIPKDTQVIIK
jgi:Uncharacterized protein conserved in bacteria